MKLSEIWMYLRSPSYRKTRKVMSNLKGHYVLLKSGEIERLALYTGCLEAWIMQKGGRDYLESLLEEFSTPLTGQGITKKPSQYQKWGSA